jgi:hypothetical protein
MSPDDTARNLGKGGEFEYTLSERFIISGPDTSQLTLMVY